MERAQQDMSYFALGVMVLGGTLAGLTQTGVNTMLPAVAADFGNFPLGTKLYVRNDRYDCGRYGCGCRGFRGEEAL